MNSDVNFSSFIDTIYESDIDDDCSAIDASVILERRRKSHIEAEQRRRNAIKNGYETLRELVYPIRETLSSSRLSKLLILNKAIADVRIRIQEVNKKKVDVCNLKKIVDTLRMTTSFYCNQVQSSASYSRVITDKLTDERLKLKIFRLLSENLFSFFTSSIEPPSFQGFAEEYLNWLEEVDARKLLCRVLRIVLPTVLQAYPDVDGDASRLQFPNIGLFRVGVLPVSLKESCWTGINKYASHSDILPVNASIPQLPSMKCAGEGASHSNLHSVNMDEATCSSLIDPPASFPEKSPIETSTAVSETILHFKNGNIFSSATTVTRETKAGNTADTDTAVTQDHGEPDMFHLHHRS